MKPTLHRSLVVDALLMAVWRRRPNEKVLLHSDQGTQYGSDDWHRFCLAHVLGENGKSYERLPVYRDFRDGDVRDSQADIVKAADRLGCAQEVRIMGLSGRCLDI